MLAAGVGRRLYGDDYEQPPKALMRFGDKSLLERHAENLKAFGVDELVLVVGHRGNEILDEVATYDELDFISSIYNPQYRGGPLISLWTARELLRSGDDILFMDADVLYHPHMLERLICSDSGNCFLYDDDIEDGEDPVRVCIRDDKPVDFGKMIEGDFDSVGEWPGFMKMTPDIAAKLADACQAYIDRAEMHVTYEVAMRDVLLSEPAGTFGFEDISDIPWIEIDFPADLIRAERHILPRLSENIGLGKKTGNSA